MIFTLVLLLLLLVNAYFSAAEIALVSVKKIKLQPIADEGNLKAKEILDVLKDPDQYLSSIQVGITLVSIIEGLYGGEKLAEYLEPILIKWSMHVGLAHAIALVFSITLITYVTIVIGELLPKSLAFQHPQKTAMWLIVSFRIFTKLAYPFVKLLTGSTHLLSNMIGIKGSENQKLTKADLRSILGLAYRQGTLEKDKWVMHDNIFNFSEQQVGAIMTPKDKVISINENASRTEIEKIFRESNHQIFPVFAIDNSVSGCIYAKDFFIHSDKTLREVVLPACKVAKEQSAAELLKRFKESNRNFAIVMTANGDMEGVVTMHDIGEELIGKIP